MFEIWDSYKWWILAPFSIMTIVWFVLSGFLKYVDTANRQGNSDIKNDKRFSYIWWFRNCLIFIQINYLKRRSPHPNNSLNRTPYLPKLHPIFIPLSVVAKRILGR